MQIPKEFLEEKNYAGTRLVEVTSPKISELHKKLTDLQLEANPHLKIMEELTPKLDPYFTKLRELEEQKNKLREEMLPIREPYDRELEKVQKIDQKAQMIKNKIQPMVLDIVSKDLGEFETARQLHEKDGKIFVEIIDELEEKIKSIRASKTKK